MREFDWCREEVARDCLRTKGHVHVCITSPKYPGVVPRCGRPYLALTFYDLDPEAIRRSYQGSEETERAKELIAGCFTEAHAEEMVRFVEKHPEEDVVVNCEAGVSRSPGVVLAFRRKYGGDTEDVFKRACPNIHVASLLGRLLKVGPFQARPVAESDGILFL